LHWLLKTMRKAILPLLVILFFLDTKNSQINRFTSSSNWCSNFRQQTTALMPLQKSIQLNVEDLTNGIYLIEVNKGEDKIYTQKLTIAH